MPQGSVSVRPRRQIKVESGTLAPDSRGVFFLPLIIATSHMFLLAGIGWASRGGRCASSGKHFRRHVQLVIMCTALCRGVACGVRHGTTDRHGSVPRRNDLRGDKRGLRLVVGDSGHAHPMSKSYIMNMKVKERKKTIKSKQHRMGYI